MVLSITLLTQLGLKSNSKVIMFINCIQMLMFAVKLEFDKWELSINRCANNNCPKSKLDVVN